MVLDALGIHGSDPGVDAESDQEAIDELVPFAALRGQSSSVAGQMDGAPRFGPHQTVALESLDRSHHRHVGDPESAGEIGHATASALDVDLGDRLAVVLRDLGGMVGPRPAVGSW